MMLQNLLPNSLPPGFSCTVLQEGIGSVMLTPQSGATLQTPDAYTQISDQYGAVELLRSQQSGCRLRRLARVGRFGSRSVMSWGQIRERATSRATLLRPLPVFWRCL